MGLIDGQPLPDPQLPAGFQRRVIVRFRDDFSIPYVDYAGDAGHDELLKFFPWWAEIESQVNALRLDLVRLFISATPEQIAGLVAEAKAFGDHNYPEHRLTYFAIDCPPTVIPAALARALFPARQEVDVAYLEALPAAPPTLISPSLSDNPLLDNQTYHRIVNTNVAAFPGVQAKAFHVNGVGSRFAWCFKGGDGTGVQFIDVEQGWDFAHKDLVASSLVKGSGVLVTGVNKQYKGHGTAVLGELVATPNNQMGGVGMVPAAVGRTASEWQTDTVWNSANAIISAAIAIGPGDVIVIESHVRGTADFLVPRECEPAVYEVILCATLAGRVVVEASGDGWYNLNNVPFLPDAVVSDWGTILRDLFPVSGAIIVGASYAGNRIARDNATNFGDRVDCFAAGENVGTSGTGGKTTGDTDYTTAFGGTSAATAIVAGAVIAIQGIKRGCLGGPFRPSELRHLLRDPALNTPSDDHATHPIGWMPDLVRIIATHLGLDQGECSADPSESVTCFDYALPRA